MSGMEILAGLGLCAAEIFRYNRENYQFDQGQRFEQEELRMKMQLERFALFREDIRDLVELTVSKMDLYSYVGALFLKGCVVYYCEGQFYHPPPPFLLSLYYLSLSCSFVYLILAVWLAMHSSICSHSYGTRLLTRFVRLPIPGCDKLDKLNARLSDFERQGKEALRVPFLSGLNNWEQRTELDGAGKESYSWPFVGKATPKAGAAAKDGSYQREEPSRTPQPQILGASNSAPGESQSPGAGTTSSRKFQSSEKRLKRQVSSCSHSSDLLDGGEAGFSGTKEDSLLFKAVELRNKRHVQLFRQLQSHWQCYDAYARVCMALGVRQLIQAVTYFLIGECLVDNNAPMLAFAATVAFQALGVGISVMDIHGLPCYGNLDLSLVGMLPGLVACTSLSLAPRDAAGELNREHTYFLALAAFPLEICWFEILHWVAAPTRDEVAVPSHFRNVLFMDVFGEVDDPTEADTITGRRILTPEERTLIQVRVSSAEGALGVAQAGLRRWEAVPSSWLNKMQRKKLYKLRRQITLWCQLLDRELEMRKLPVLQCTEQPVRLWRQLSTAEREDDPWSGTVLGPLEYFTGTGLPKPFHYDLEGDQFLYELQPTHKVFTFKQIVSAVRTFRHEVDGVCRTASGKVQGHGGHHHGGASLGHHHGDSGYAGPSLESGDSRPMGHGSGDIITFERQTSSSTFSAASGAYQAPSPKSPARPVKSNAPRLPWVLTSAMTRLVQFAWFFIGMVCVLREFSIFKIDYMEANIVEERRLVEQSGEAASWSFTALEVAWPHGAFFRPKNLLCFPGPAQAGGALLLGSPYAFYWAVLSGQRPLHLAELTSLAREPLPPSTAAICGLPPALQRAPELEAEAITDSCLLGTPTPEGVALWQPGGPSGTSQKSGSGNASLVETDGAPWRLLAGATVPCESPEHWCVLLAGWGGGEELSVALAELPGNAAGPLPGRRRPLQRTELPLATVPAAAGAVDGKASTAAAVMALHVEPGRGRLWALMAGGELQAWDLLPLPARRLGGWRASWPLEMGTFHPTALCADADSHRLLVAGHRAGEDGGPLLLQSEVPRLGLQPEEPEGQQTPSRYQ